jgi:tRNA G18 (ribose-2'-O)-methylase SpoU
LQKDADPVSLLKENGFLTAAMALREGAIPPDADVLKEADQLAVFLGTEGTGLPDAVIDSCDHQVMIPMAGGVDSLNVAAAGAVIFWELTKH